MDGEVQTPEPAEGSVPAGDFTPVLETSEPVIVATDAMVLGDDVALIEIAQEVVAGRWGRGNRRKARLREAGLDPELVQHEVDKIFNR